MIFLTHRVSVQRSPSNFPKTFCIAKNGGHFEFFAKFAKHKSAYILKTMLDRAILMKFLSRQNGGQRLYIQAEHFLNTLALTFISFLGRFVFAVQKHYPLVLM